MHKESGNFIYQINSVKHNSVQEEEEAEEIKH